MGFDRVAEEVRLRISNASPVGEGDRVFVLIKLMSTLSSEYCYATDYLTCLVLKIDRPDVKEYGLGVQVADSIRQAINDALPDGLKEERYG